jgi:transposase
LKPHMQTTIETLLRAGRSQREIERVTGIDRKTIRSYHKRLMAPPANSPGVATGDPPASPPPRPAATPPTPATPVATAVASICEPHREFIEAQVRLRRNATAIYQDLVDQHGFGGAYNSVKRFVNRLRHKEPEQFDRLEFLPGEEMQVDYGEGALTLVPGTQRYRKPRLFVATLRYSRRCFRRVVWKSGQQVWASLHEQAWRYFGGSCRYVVLDNNLKEGVLKPDLYEPQINPVYAATRATRAASWPRPRRSASRPNGCASCCSPSKAAWANASSGASSTWPGATRAHCWSGPARRRWPMACTATTTSRRWPIGWWPRNWPAWTSARPGRANWNWCRSTP